MEDKPYKSEAYKRKALHEKSKRIRETVKYLLIWSREYAKAVKARDRAVRRKVESK